MLPPRIRTWRRLCGHGRGVAARLLQTVLSLPRRIVSGRLRTLGSNQLCVLRLTREQAARQRHRSDISGAKGEVQRQQPTLTKCGRDFQQHGAARSHEDSEGEGKGSRVQGKREHYESLQAAARQHR